MTYITYLRNLNKREKNTLVENFSSVIIGLFDTDIAIQFIDEPNNKSVKVVRPDEFCAKFKQKHSR